MSTTGAIAEGYPGQSFHRQWLADLVAAPVDESKYNKGDPLDMYLLDTDSLMGDLSFPERRPLLVCKRARQNSSSWQLRGDHGDLPQALAAPKDLKAVKDCIRDARSSTLDCREQISWFHFDDTLAATDTAVAECALSIVSDPSVRRFYVGVTENPHRRFFGSTDYVPYDEVSLSAKPPAPHCESFSSMDILAVRRPRGTWCASLLERCVIRYFNGIDEYASKMRNRSGGGERITKRAAGIFLYIVYSTE